MKESIARMTNTIRSLLTPQMAGAFAAFVTAVIGLAVQFGVHVTADQAGAILAVVGATFTVLNLAFHVNATAAKPPVV